MSTFNFVDRIFLAALALVCSIFGIFVLSNLSVSASEVSTGCGTYNADYDCNNNGIIDFGDVDCMKSDVIESHNSSYNVVDLVAVKHIMLAASESANVSYLGKLKNSHTLYKATELDVTTENNWLFINFFTSDFEKFVSNDDGFVTFDFAENNEINYSILFSRSNVVYNEVIDYDYLVRCDIKETSYYVFIRNNEYMLNVSAPQIAPAIALEDFTCSEPNIDTLAELFTSNYVVRHVEATAEKAELLFTKSDHSVEYIIRLPIGEVNEVMPPENCETWIGKALGMTNCSYMVEPDVELITMLFSTDFTIVRVSNTAESVEIMFSSNTADYIIRLPYANNVR